MSEAANDYILIVEPDVDLLRTFTAHFDRIDEFKYYTAGTGDEAVTVALQKYPRLILIETQLPDRPALLIFQELKLYPRTAHIPMIFMAGGTEVLLRKQILEAGAHDFLQKPVDLAELALRIRNALRQYKQHVHPDTHLPSGKLAQETLDRLMQPGANFFAITVTIMGFDIFRDIYGFITAREVYTFAGNVLNDIVNEYGTAEDYVGHKSDSVFVVVTTPIRGPVIHEHIITRLGSQLTQFYNFMERDQGYVEVSDDTGNLLRKSLMRLQTEISSSEK